MTDTATKPEPVRILGAVTVGITTVVSGLTVIYHDNAQVMIVLGIVGVVVAAATAAKDQYVRGQVIPAADVLTYVNKDREAVSGPAGLAPTVGPARHAAPDIDDTL